jgi:hypothetical protein
MPGPFAGGLSVPQISAPRSSSDIRSVPMRCIRYLRRLNPARARYCSGRRGGSAISRRAIDGIPPPSEARQQAFSQSNQSRAPSCLEAARSRPITLGIGSPPPPGPLFGAPASSRLSTARNPRKTANGQATRFPAPRQLHPMSLHRLRTASPIRATISLSIAAGVAKFSRANPA